MNYGLTSATQPAMSIGGYMIQTTITCQSSAELRELAAFLTKLADMRDAELKRALAEQQEYAKQYVGGVIGGRISQ